jgi:hypothetical protein
MPDDAPAISTTLPENFIVPVWKVVSEDVWGLVRTAQKTRKASIILRIKPMRRAV